MSRFIIKKRFKYLWVIIFELCTEVVLFSLRDLLISVLCVINMNQWCDLKYYIDNFFRSFHYLIGVIYPCEQPFL